MIPAPFEYVAAESAPHALELLATDGDDAKLLAGGHSLLPMMKLRLAVPSVLIDIGPVTELAGIRADGDDLVIGATTPARRGRRVRADTGGGPAAGLFGGAGRRPTDPAPRHHRRLARARRPGRDLPMALTALGGSVELTGPGGTRSVTADDFFVGYFETSLEPDELLTAVRVPRRPAASWGYQKFVRRANDWAIVGGRDRGRPDRAGQHGAGPRPGPGRGGGAGGRGQPRAGGRAGGRRHRAR